MVRRTGKNTERHSERRNNRRNDRKNDDNLRALLAQEAARIIRNQGVDDFRLAKFKAADNLGFSQRGALPGNREIEAALAEQNRIFGGPEHASLLASLRQAALDLMYELEHFGPCLVGPVLSGNITQNSPINLHLFSDTSEVVGMQLNERGIRHNSTLRKHRTRRDRFEQFPGYRIYTADFEVEATVFPERAKAHAPLSPVDGKPMRRAKLKDVEALASH
jgi:hypothetical protein